LILLAIMGCENPKTRMEGEGVSIPALPTPRYDSETSVEEALRSRRSVRTYSSTSLSLREVSQLLWAAHGVTHPEGWRAAPSAGALYPLEIHVVAGNVTHLPAGVYQYNPQDHELILVREGDVRQQLFEAALKQSAVKDGSMVLIISAEYERTTGKYGQRGIRYVHMEVGHASQNVYLQAEALNLGTVFIGAFHDDEVKTILQLSEDVAPLGLMPVGKVLPAGTETP
jgi:SagB-type dehydrogenase family enzyme